jgi:hypothetical protein
MSNNSLINTENNDDENELNNVDYNMFLAKVSNGELMNPTGLGLFIYDKLDKRNFISKFIFNNERNTFIKKLTEEELPEKEYFNIIKNEFNLEDKLFEKLKVNYYESIQQMKNKLVDGELENNDNSNNDISFLVNDYYKTNSFINRNPYLPLNYVKQVDKLNKSVTNTFSIKIIPILLFQNIGIILYTLYFKQRNTYKQDFFNKVIRIGCGNLAGILVFLVMTEHKIRGMYLKREINKDSILKTLFMQKYI